MIYLDYSATTKASDRVLKKLMEIEKSNFANPNQMHKLGLESKKTIDESIKKITSMINIKENELIFTSGASESNNTVLKGLKVNHIITTKLEHSSITTPCGYLQTQGIKVSFVEIDKNGLVNIENLKKLITKEETLVSVGAVNSETGIRQNIEEIGKILKKYPNVTFHSDITQALGKTKLSLENIDLASFSLHKIFGLKGIGGLIKKQNIRLIPLIHGGKAITIYRSGTPQTGLIASSEVAIEESLTNIEENYQKVKELNEYLKENIKDLVEINSNENCIPHILNISIKNKDSEDTLKFFSENDIYLSSKTACSSGSYSFVINELYNMERAETSIRISLSHKTTKEELDIFINKLKEWLKCK